MTFGSPIDKHIVLWPNIWKAFRTPGAPGGHLATANNPPVARPIRWRNYYDYGDPVGFELDTARAWMRDDDHLWAPAFEFTAQHDYGFSRYVLPGAAHNEYWGDRRVFGHFIQTVMRIAPQDGRDYSAPPPNRWWARVGSYLIPYFLVVALLYAGTYLLYKGLGDYLAPPKATPGEIAAERRAAPNRDQEALIVRWWRGRVE
jgi:hypothetical protein